MISALFVLITCTFRFAKFTKRKSLSATPTLCAVKCNSKQRFGNQFEAKYSLRFVHKRTFRLLQQNVSGCSGFADFETVLRF